MPTYKNATTGKWFCKFYYQDYDGKRKQKFKRGFALKRDAEAWERDFLLSSAFQPSMPFSAFYALYTKDTAPRLREHTLQTRGYQYKNHLAPFFGNMPINEITPPVVIQWQNTLINAGYSGVYQNNLYRLLAAVFNHACRFYGLATNPCHKARAIGSKRPALEMDFWTLDEFKAAYNAIEDSKARAAVALLYWSGIRKGELLALLWSDINRETGTLSISKSFQRLGGRDVVTPPKTPKSNRAIILPRPALEALETYKAALFRPSENDAIFSWEKYFIENAIKTACELSSVKRIRVHDLRHSHASLLIHLGYSPVLIAQRLGHEKIETTLNTYSHLYPSKESEMIDQLNAL